MVIDMHKLVGLSTGVLIVAGLTVACSPSTDSCAGLTPCEQYECRNPQFYCAGVLYDSQRRPENLEDARNIVIEYVTQELGTSVEVLSSAQGGGDTPWYQITCRLGNGTENGFEVGPDGKIYRIKHWN